MSIYEQFIVASGESPFYFQLGGSSGLESQELNETIERLFRYGKVQRTHGNHYQLTDSGRQYVGDSAQLRLDRIDEAFEHLVNKQVSGE